MRSVSFKHHRREETAGQRTEYRGPAAESGCEGNHVVIIRLPRRALSSRSSGARIEKGVREVEEAEFLRLQQLRDLGSVIAAANKACIPRLAAFDDTFQPFEHAVRAKKVSKAQCLVAPPLQVRSGCDRTIVNLNHIDLVALQAP